MIYHHQQAYRRLGLLEDLILKRLGLLLGLDSILTDMNKG